MSKQKQISIKLSHEEVEIVKDILEKHQEGYSYKHPPERIISVRNVIEKLNT